MITLVTWVGLLSQVVQPPAPAQATLQQALVWTAPTTDENGATLPAGAALTYDVEMRRAGEQNWHRMLSLISDTHVQLNSPALSLQLGETVELRVRTTLEGLSSNWATIQVMVVDRLPVVPGVPLDLGFRILIIGGNQ